MSKAPKIADFDSPKGAARRGRPASNPEKIADMKAAIATQARGLFVEEGYSAVSMRRIAAQIGCSPMSLYRYYPAKIDILRHLWAELFEKLFKELAKVGDQFSEATPRLHAIANRYVAYWLENPDHYRMVFMTETVSQGEVGVFVDEGQAVQQYEIFYSLISDIIVADSETIRVLSDSLVCALNGVAHCLITISGYRWPKADQLVASLVNGLLAVHTKK
jgi:AcrR family transcriptional regulator